MSKSEPFSPTAEQKRSALEHVRYEMQQLAALYELRSSHLTSALNNARIEATVVHLSILVSFFEDAARKFDWDDVLAVDYGFPKLSFGIKGGTLARRNTEVAHLSYTRTERTPEERAWDFDGLIRPVLERAREFIKHICGTAGFVNDVGECERWRRVDQFIEHVLTGPTVTATSNGTSAKLRTTNTTSTQDPQTIFVAIDPCTILGKPAERSDSANGRATAGASTEVKPRTDAHFPSPWPIDRLIQALEQGDTLAQLVAPNRGTGGHDVREHLLERLFGDIAAEVFGVANVVLRRQIRTTLGLKTPAFPGTAQPDVAVRRAGRVHICEVKSNRYDYDRFDCVFESKPFREFLAKAGHVGPDPWEVEQDLIKLNQFPTLSDRVGSCLFLMVDAYRGSGRSWRRAFRDRAAFIETVRTPLARAWADRLLQATQVVALKAPGASANLIVCEVHAWHETDQDQQETADGPTL